MALFKSWDSYLSTEETNDLLTEIAWKHLDTVQEIDRNDQWSRVRDCLRARDFAGLSQLELDVRGLSADACAHLSQVLAFWKKRQDLDLGVDRKAVAFAKFEASELTCASTNSLFRRWKQGDFTFPPAVERVLHLAQRKIDHVLGECPELEQFKVRFGPGSTTQVQKRKACSKVKLSQRPACSEDLLPLLVPLLESVPAYIFPHESEGALTRHLDNNDFLSVDVEDYLDERLPENWRESDSLRDYKELLETEQYRLRREAPRTVEQESVLVEVEIHNGKLDFVPKNAKTDRSIVVEPWLNSILQLGIGDYMAKRLRRFGVDIRDQTRNQNLARLGSITGALATLDLSSASDSVSIGLVEHLLGPDWFDLLMSARSGKVDYQGQTRHLEKISSMGNGFTFPLETLLFWAITTAVCGNDSQVSVYGDDIICPTENVEEVVSTLSILGFTINREKSFWDGPFRESCGRDYLSGIDVRPLFLDGPMNGQDAFRLHNFYVRKGGMESFSAVLYAAIAPHVALTGPDGYGDGHLVVDGWQSKTPLWVTRRGFGGCTFDTWVYRKRDFKVRLPGDRVLPVYSIYLREEGLGVVDTCRQRERQFLTWLRGQDKDSIPHETITQGMRFLRDGTPVQYVPGASGCKRISVYTFEKPYLK